MFLGSKCVRVSMVACAIVLVLVFTNQEDIVVARTALLSQAAATQEWMRDETTTLTTTISGGVVPQQSNEEFVGGEPSEMHSPSSFSSLSPSSSASSSLTLLTVRNVFRAASLPPFARKKTQARDEKGGIGHSSRRSYASGEMNEALAAWLKRKLMATTGASLSPSVSATSGNNNRSQVYDVRLHEHRSGANSSSSSSSIAVIRVPLGDMNAVDLPRLIRALHEAETLLFKASDSAHHGDQHQGKPVIRGQGVLLCVASAAVATRTGSEDTNSAEWGQRQEGEQQHAAGLSSNSSSSNLCWLPSGVTVESILARLATDVVSYDDAELEEIPDDEVVVAKRIMVGPSITRSEAAASCLISNQGGLLGSGVHAPFATNVPVPTPPLLITRDIVQFILNYFAQDVIEVFDDIVDHHHSTNDANDAAKTATSSSDEQKNSSPSTRSSSRSTHHDDSPPMIAIRRSPIAAACGIPMRIRALSPQQYPFPLPPIPLHHCIGLFMSGRDVHRVTFADWNPISASIPLDAQDEHPRNDNNSNNNNNNNNSNNIAATNRPENAEKLHSLRLNRLAKISATSMRVEEQMPFVWLTGDTSGKRTLARNSGLPWRDETSGTVGYVHTHIVDITPPGRFDAVTTTSVSDGVIAAVYVPTRIDQFGMRDMVRCYYRSLERPVRDRLALHFLLGARATMDSRFVFRGRGDVRAEDTYIADGSGLSVWHRLALENRSHDFERRSTGVARNSGDLLLLDVIDLDRAPYSTKSEESLLRGVWRAKETLVKPRRGRRPQWHHVSEVSAMLIKLLVGMAHMVQQYPTSRFFVRGADDAYVSFRQVYVDVLKLVSEEEKRVASSRRKYFGGHVITTAINNVCGNFEVSKSGVLYRSGGVSRDRALAPVMSPAYVSGGGSTMNAELVRQLVHSLQDVPPTLWLEEDTMIGRLTAPMVRPTKDFRFHNFFNATQRVDTAFQGQVPRAYIYCHQNSWVVHKYPAPSALSFVDAKTLFMYCTRHDFMSARATAHHCAATLDARFVRSQQVSQKGDRDEGVDDTAKEANMSTTNTTDVTSSSAGSHHVSTRVRWPTWKLGPPAYYAPYHHHSARIGGGLRGGGGGLVNRQMKRGQPCKPKNIGMLIAHAPRDCHQNLDEA